MFIVDGNLPFSTIQQPSLSNLLSLVACKPIVMPKPKVLMTYLADCFIKMKSKLVNALGKQKYICVTCDVWSSHAQSYLGMTVHYLNENFERESFVLAFRQLKEKQTNDVLASEIIKVFDEFGIAVEKVRHIVTDGGSSFCKAFKVYGSGSDVLVENNYTHSNENEDEDKDEDDINNGNDQQENMGVDAWDAVPFIHYDDGEYFFSNLINFNNDGEQHDIDVQLDEVNILEDRVYENNLEIDDYFNIAENNDERFKEIAKPKLPSHRRCLSHLLNLVGTDFEKGITGRAQTALYSTFGKLQTIWVLPSYLVAALKQNRFAKKCSVAP